MEGTELPSEQVAQSTTICRSSGKPDITGDVPNRQLPPLREVTVLVGMSPEQCALYRETVSDYLRATANNAPCDPCVGLNTLMRLRMVCNHPALHAGRGSDDDPPETRSGKLWALNRLLYRLRRRGASRVVLAGQMTRMLDKIEEWLDRGGVATRRLDGSTPPAERVAAIEAFQKDGSEFLAFLLSARAGGIGVDLSAADALIIVDPDWNPHIEQSLVDRVATGRVAGQARPVTVVRLITAGTVEEKLVQMRSELAAEGLVSTGNKDRVAAIITHRANDFLNSSWPSPVTDADVARTLESAFPCA